MSPNILRLLLCFLGLSTLPWAVLAEKTTEVLVIVGAPGELQYQDPFQEAALNWSRLAREADANFALVGLEFDADLPDKEIVLNWLNSRDKNGPNPLWIAYIGHGTSNTEGTRLNLRDDDLSLTEIKECLSDFDRPIIFVHGGSASAPFITELAKPGRIVITATKSANEQNYARFGEAFAANLGSPNTDLDRDGQISVLEAFLVSTQQVESYYQEENRLATELALLDDTGSGAGVSVDAFDSLKLNKAFAQSHPGIGTLARRTALVHSRSQPELSDKQLSERNELEAELDTLRQSRESTSEEAYFLELEKILRKLSVYYLEDS